MFRTSSFLAILVSATAIGSATVPAAAGSLQVFGGGSHLAQLPSTAPVLTRPQPVQTPHTIPTAPGSSTVSGKTMIPAPGISSVRNAELPIPVSHGGTSVKNAELPKQDLPPIDICALHPYLPMCKSLGGGGSGSGGSGSGSAGGSGSGSGGSGSGSAGGSGSGSGGSGSGSASGGTGKGGGSGPVVIVVPPVPVRVPIAVPVTVPVGVPVNAPGAMPYGSASRIGAGGGTSAATAQAQPVITPHCMTAEDNPPLATMIDQLLPTAPLSDAARAQVNELRQTIQVLETDGKDAAARDTEEVAMNVLGYQKVWLRCGAGVFTWQKQVTSADAGQQK